MLNIISLSLFSNKPSGPKKVSENLIKGLDKLNYPYVINKSLDSCERLWIHDDLEALEKVSQLDPKIKVVIGPNLFISGSDFPNFRKGIDLSRVVYLHPSEWVKQRCIDFGFKQCRLDFWPTGIDLDEFKPSKDSSKDFVLIYFKQRFDDELNAITDILKQKGIAFKIIKYGNYKEKDYLKLLKDCRYIIWLGRHESQGIALEEALASNIPMLIFDVPSVGHWVPTQEEKSFSRKEIDEYVGGVTVAPYFDSSCGIKIKKISEIEKGVDEMEENWQTFTPREYILKNLSLKKQARDFLNIYEKYWGLSYNRGLSEKLLKKGKYKNNFLIKLNFIILNLIKSHKNIYEAYKILKLKVKNRQ